MVTPRLLPGLSDATSVGRFGRFTADAGNRTIALNTCVVNDVAIHTLGRWAKLIGEPAVGPRVTTRVVRNTWAGRTIELRSRGATQRIDLYTTLPGPLFTAGAARWGFDWAVGASFTDLEGLPDGRALHAWGVIERPPRILLCRHAETPCLVATSAPAKRLTVITHEHWWFDFAAPGARILIVPLLDVADAPRTPALAKLWLDLVERPPVRMAERFAVRGDELVIEATASDARGRAVRACPIPPMASLLGDGSFQRIERGVTLLSTYAGPYAVAPRATRFRRTLALDWLRTAIAPTRAPAGELSPIPRELVYAGDISWDESYPMDALLSLRQWAPLAGVLPPATWDAIKARIRIPTPKTFRATLAKYVEPSVKGVWLKDRTLFAQWGEVSYDTDWYTGLSLAGMWRAATCADPAVAAAGKKLYRGLRRERDGMIGYCRVFSDWAFDGAFTDPRGEGYDYDCSHNAIEGVLAEARMRDSEGDSAGRDFCWYLAARFAACFLAAFPLAELHRAQERLNNAPEDIAAGVYGLRVCRERWGSWALTPNSPSWPPLFPEYARLLERHGPLDRLRELARAFEQRKPERYRDWLLFYVGPEQAAKIRAGREDASANQEHREQAAVFYHVAPDAMLRLWVLGEDADAVERRFQTAMPLAEQVLCRAAYRLVEEPPRRGAR